MNDEVGQLGETLETKAIEATERTSDGTLSFSRAQMAEAEIVRDSFAPSNAAEYGRALLLLSAEESPAILHGWSMTPLDDRLIVKYASHREGYVCEECSGSGMTDSVCPVCNGYKKRSPKPGWKEEPCPDCKIIGSESMTPSSCGFIPCGSCKGTGLAPGVMAIPDASKQDHSYGDIQVCGSQVYDLRQGDRVVFSKLAGIYVKGDNGNYCLLRRGEIMGLMLKK
jgi:co-chaperonin GroES (HSP10)